MKGMWIQHAIKGVYALAIAWVIVTVVNSKPWGSQQAVSQPIEQPIVQSTPYPDALTAPSADPIDPRVQSTVGWVRTWDVNTTAEWVAWCLRNNDGLNGPDDRGELICKALKVK